VNAIWSVEITNADTSRVIDLTHQTYEPGGGTPPGETKVWPGMWFDIESTEAQAILGSLVSFSFASRGGRFETDDEQVRRMAWRLDISSRSTNASLEGISGLVALRCIAIRRIMGFPMRFSGSRRVLLERM
jgi:hypothetical protein